MSQLDFVELIEHIASRLQGELSTGDINVYLRRFGVKRALDTSVSSKRLYVKTILAESDDDLILNIAEDLGIVTLGDPAEQTTATRAVSEPYAFISYQTQSRAFAGKLKEQLSRIDVACFLAHEDIDVSEEWRIRLLEELAKSSLFIALLTKEYFSSVWCVQESGIAAFRKDWIVAPLSIDGSIPQGFLGHVQSKRVALESLSLRDLLPSFVRQDLQRGLDIGIRIVGKSFNYRDAEANFEVLQPHIPKLSEAQIKDLLEYAAKNDQVLHATRCARIYLPPLIRSHGHLLAPDVEQELKDTCQRYGASI